MMLIVLQILYYTLHIIVHACIYTKAGILIISLQISKIDIIANLVSAHSKFMLGVARKKGEIATPANTDRCICDIYIDKKI